MDVDIWYLVNLLPSSCAGYLSGKNVESLGSCETSTDIGVCQGD